MKFLSKFSDFRCLKLCFLSLAFLLIFEILNVTNDVLPVLMSLLTQRPSLFRISDLPLPNLYTLNDFIMESAHISNDVSQICEYKDYT